MGCAEIIGYQVSFRDTDTVYCERFDEHSKAIEYARGIARDDSVAWVELSAFTRSAGLLRLYYSQR